MRTDPMLPLPTYGVGAGSGSTKGAPEGARREQLGAGSTQPVEELPLVAALAKRRAARAEQREQFAAARKVGLKRRHEQKLKEVTP